MSRATQPLLGAHFSISKGFEQAIRDAESIECTTAQIFLHSNRQWSVKPVEETTATSFKKFLHASTINPLITHAGYLINLASDNNAIIAKSTKTLLYELETSHQLSISYVVLHPGSNANVAKGLENIIRNINTVFEKSKHTTLLLENTAGQGSSLCWSFEEIATIINGAHHKKQIGVCLDTCHAFAAGYDFTTPAAYKKFWEHFDKTIGMDYLKAIHLNDSKKNLGSRVDRHENIGKGQIGLEAFGLLMNDAHLTNIPKILETPYDSYEDACSTYKHDMETLLKLIK
jgi:deoxyribonuclease-4